jgi:hypothetical protein
MWPLLAIAFFQQTSKNIQTPVSACQDQWVQHMQCLVQMPGTGNIVSCRLIIGKNNKTETAAGLY